METLVVVVSTQVKELEELVFPKPIPLVIPEVEVGAEVTLIGIVTHASEVFRTPNKYRRTHLLLKDQGLNVFL